MKYKVCIPVAGLGSRLEQLTKHVNKSLVSVANKPILTHIIEKFPKDIEIVMPLGYKKETVTEFLSLAYPDRKFSFAVVDPYEGPGSGLGLSMLCCRHHLDCPFIFISCDTLVDEEIPEPTINWMGYATVDDPLPYRCIRKDRDNSVTELCEKGETKNVFPYIGLSGIYDHALFWKIMEDNRDKGSVQIGESFALRQMLENGKIQARPFTWNDTGNPKALRQSRKKYSRPDDPNILDKPDEAIWFVGDRVIKYSAKETFIRDRVERSRMMSGFVPPIIDSTKNMYAYQKVEGEVLSKEINLPIFERLLWYSGEFWKEHPLSPNQQEEFFETCRKFYEDKTRDRVEMYFKTFDKRDCCGKINGIEVPTIKQLLAKVDWKRMSRGKPVRFHGDFHFENILTDPSGTRFFFLDWRQEFGGVMEYGDLYYDLGKLNHGIIMCHELVNKNLFSVDDSNPEEVRYDFHRKQILCECESYFEDYLQKQGFDVLKVKLMTFLIYLNIAALHHDPYCHLLFHLGKLGLHRTLLEERTP